jgi:homoserine O-acetyltransferase/O-succinyltransferase
MSSVPLPAFEGDFSLSTSEPFRLDAGGALQQATLRYTTYGELNAGRDNVVLVCHALSGSSRVADWWPQLFGAEGVFDLERDYILCANILGSCYGSTGPTSINPVTGLPYGPDFPLVTINDIVRSQALLLDRLGIERVRIVIGGSIGGMQALAWASEFPGRVDNCISIGTTPLPAMGLALNHLQRQVIMNDPKWRGGYYPKNDPPVAGLGIARGMAMCSYKAAALFDHRYARTPNRNEDPRSSMEGRYNIGGYLDHQAEKFNDRFDANSYVTISKTMDNFDLHDAAIARIRARVLAVGISSDWLFPAADVRALVARMQSSGVNCTYAEVISDHGHDGFLAEPEKLRDLLLPIFEGRGHAAPAS